MKRTGMALDATCAQACSPLRVLFVTRYFYPFVGGLEKRIHTIARELAARGIEVEILTARQYPEFPSEQTLDDVTIHRLDSPRIKVIGACVFIARLVRFLYLRRERYQFLHAFQVGHSSAAAVLTGRLLGKHVFLHLSGGGSGGDVLRHLKTPWGLIFLGLCRCASTIVVLNAQMRRELKVLLYPSARTACIPNGVDTDQYQPAHDRLRVRQSLALPARPVVLYTGRLSPEKGLATLVRAWKLLRSPSAPALHIVGSGPAQAQLQRLIQKLRLDDTVTLVPACSDVRPYYQCADIFVMPSFHEGLSNSVLEAMSCALPVVATAVSGNTDLVNHRLNGLLVPPKDEPALAAALDELLDNPGLAREMGSRGRIIAQKSYSCSEMIGRYCALYGPQGP